MTLTTLAVSKWVVTRRASLSETARPPETIAGSRAADARLLKIFGEEGVLGPLITAVLFAIADSAPQHLKCTTTNIPRSPPPFFSSIKFSETLRLNIHFHEFSQDACLTFCHVASFGTAEPAN